MLPHIRSILIIIDKTPYQQRCGQEQLEFILAAAAFDHQITLVFIDSGIFHLYSSTPQLPGIKPYTNLYKGLEHYNIDNCLILNSESISITPIDPAIKFTEINNNKLNKLIIDTDLVYMV